MNSTVTAALITALALSSAMGCSSAESKDPGPGTAGTSTTPAPTATAPEDGTLPADKTPAPPKAPTMDGIMKMHGALHVSWTNEEPSCTAVELERKTATAAWKVVYTLPGEADNKHDASATAATMYTYRARCKKATTYSAYSNEKSGTP